MSSPRSVSHDFARFERIFGVIKKKNPKRRADHNVPAAKRKSLGDQTRLPVVKPEDLGESNTSNSAINESSEKIELMPFLSAQDFVIEGWVAPNLRITDSWVIRLIFSGTAASLNKTELEQNSPDIDDFSDEDEEDLCREQVAMTNQRLREIMKKKSQYRPKNKAPKSGGVVERLCAMRGKQEAKALQFLRSKEQVEGQQRIEIVHQSQFRKRVLLHFCFPNLQDDEEERQRQRVLVASPDFKLALKVQRHFDVIFDRPEQQIRSNCFLHFAASMIKAGR